MRAADEAVRAAYPQALATLTRVLGSMDTASDALHVAVERALSRWPGQVPQNPTAWLVRTARNYSIDQTRRRSVHARAVEVVRDPDAQAGSAVDVDALHLRDDMLRLIFTCCHPRLSPDSQVALTLHTVIGLSVAEIARAYMAPPKAMERRLTRARVALREAAVGYDVPSAAELPQRLAAACVVVESLFDQGYSYPADARHLRPQLCALAIRLARLLARMFARDAEVAGLLALLLLQHARTKARLKPDGAFVSLMDQDRSLWDRAMILEGQALVHRARFHGARGPYQLQAAIAAVHCTAPRFQDTAWDEIAALYGLLAQARPTATVALNRAVAVAKASGPAAGLDALAALAPKTRDKLQAHHRFHAVLGHLLEELARHADAIEAFERAVALAPGPVELEYLRDKLRALRGQGVSDSPAGLRRANDEQSH